MLLLGIWGTLPVNANWFQPTVQVQEDPLEITPKKKQSILSIEHELTGTLDIRAWDHEHITVTAHKKMHPDDITSVVCSLTQTDQGIITLHIHATKELRSQGTVDITVYVPHTLNMTISTQEAVSIAHTHGSVRVRTHKGDIKTTETRGALNLETGKGDIHIQDAYDALVAHTERGTITIERCYKSVQAETDRGSITAICAAVPSTALINLTSNKRGVLKLSIPESAEARLTADTTRGTITSDVLITVDRHTTLLNPGAYKDMQQHIRGIVGQHGTATIQLAASGDIHLSPYESEVKP